MHSISQELVMLHDISMDDAQEIVQEMKDRVAEGYSPEAALRVEGLEVRGAWVEELREDLVEDDDWEAPINEHRMCYGD